jgi:hypothetical protein
LCVLTTLDEGSRLWGKTLSELRARLLPLNMWSEVLGGVTYASNSLPSDRVGIPIPQGVRNDKPLKVLRHMRVLGCICYYRVPHSGGKLAPRVQRAFLVGYGSSSFGYMAVYCVYDAELRRVVDSTDVDLDEREADGITGTLSLQTMPTLLLGGGAWWEEIAPPEQVKSQLTPA